MNNAEIVSRIRRILKFSNEVRDTSGHFDLVTSHVVVISALTELLLDILESPEI